ncbi:MAG: hypothetical protein WED34_00375 [Planctomycetales bacterium]
MNEPFACRLLLEPEPGSGAWNMAVDEALLDTALRRGLCTVRLYRWAEATLSLGYFQKPDEAVADARLAELPRVRRLTGGGAILHHHEWTYSCVLPPGHPLAAVPHLLYEHVHKEVLAVLAPRGVAAALRGDGGRVDPVGRIANPSKVGPAGSAGPGARVAASSVDPRSGGPPGRAGGRIGDPSCAPPEAFLCFARGDARDVVCAGHKVLGSAQRRRRGAVLQHGSLLLLRSEFAPEFPGLRDLVPAAELDSGFAEEIAERLARALAGAGKPAEAGLPADRPSSDAVFRGELTEGERAASAHLLTAAAAVAARRTPVEAPVELGKISGRDC